MKKKIGIVLLATLLVLTGCGKVAKLDNGQDAVITLKEGGITVDDLYEEMKNKYALDVLINMIDTKILEEKYPADESEKLYIKNQIQQTVDLYPYYSSQYATYESFIQAYYGVTTDAELNKVLSLSYKRNVAIEDYAKSLVTDKEIKDYYEKETIGNITASHILITPETKTGDSDADKAAADTKALELAKEIIKKLDNKEDFAALAKEYSKDGSASDGGKLPEFNEGDMVEPFFNAAKALKVGEYSKEPVKSEFGYHIILKTAQKEKPTLESVKSVIVEKIAETKLNESTNMRYKALEKLREEHGLTFEDTELKKQYENYLFNTLK